MALHRDQMAPARGGRRVRHDLHERRPVRPLPVRYHDGDAPLVPAAQRAGPAQVDAGPARRTAPDAPHRLRSHAVRRQLDRPRRPRFAPGRCPR